LGFGRALCAIGVAHAQRQFVGQLAQLGRVQVGDGLRHAHALEQHVLQQRGDVQARSLSAQRFSDAFDFLALGIGLLAVCKGGHQGHGEQAALFLKGHGVFREMC